MEIKVNYTIPRSEVAALIAYHRAEARKIESLNNDLYRKRYEELSKKVGRSIYSAACDGKYYVALAFDDNLESLDKTVLVNILITNGYSFRLDNNKLVVGWGSTFQSCDEEPKANESAETDVEKEKSQFPWNRLDRLVNTQDQLP